MEKQGASFWKCWRSKFENGGRSLVLSKKQCVELGAIVAYNSGSLFPASGT